MDSLLLANLEKKIVEWVTESCETEAWEKIDVPFPDETEVLMARSAESVFDGIVASSRYTYENE